MAAKGKEGSKASETSAETSTPIGGTADTAGTQPQDVTSAAPIEGGAQPSGT
jgi:hypothetical protein